MTVPKKINYVKMIAFINTYKVQVKIRTSYLLTTFDLLIMRMRKSDKNANIFKHDFGKRDAK